MATRLTTEEQITMFDFTVEELDACINSMDSRQLADYAISMLSDVQDMMAMSHGGKETIRRTLNRVKYFLDHVV